MNIDSAIVGIFLIITLIVGLRHGKNVKTIQDFALGKHKFTTGALVATMSATWASGSSFFITIENTYTNGLFYLIASCCMGIQFLIMGYILSPRMKEFMGDLSVAESIGKLYGKEARIVTAVCGFIGDVGVVAVQFKALGTVFGYFFNYSDTFAIVVTSITVILYSTWGGIRAVTITDMLQFFAFGIALPLIGLIIWGDIYTPDFEFSKVVSSDNFNINNVFDLNNAKSWGMIPLIFYYTVPALRPSTYQRLLISEDLKQAKRICIYAAIIIIVLKLVIAWLPFLIYNIDSSLLPKNVVSYIIDNYTYPGLKGVLTVAIVAMAMSSADSGLNSSSVLFAHDFCAPLNIFKNKQLLVSRLFSGVLGSCAIILALSEQDLLSILLLVNSFYMPIVTVPLLISILGFRTSRANMLASMFVSFTTVVTIRLLSLEYDPIMMGMLANTLTLFGIHYLTGADGGWTHTLKKDPDEVSLFQKVSIAFSKETVTEFIGKYSPKSPSSYSGIGIYYIFYTFSVMYSTMFMSLETDILLIIYQIMMVSGMVLMLQPIWPHSISDKIRETAAKILWFSSIFYMLIIFSGFFVLISEFAKLQFVIFTINILLVIMLVGWKGALLMTAIGFYVSIMMFRHFSGIDSLDLLEIGSPAFIMIYSLVLLSTVLVIFLKPKQEYIEETEAKVENLESEITYMDYELNDVNRKVGAMSNEISSLNQKVDYYSERVSDQEKEIERLGSTAQRILNNVNHELRLPIGNVMNFAEMLYEGVGKLSPEDMKMMSEGIYQDSTRLSTMILNMLDLAMLSAKEVKLNKKKTNLSETVETRVKFCRNVYMGEKHINFKLTINPEVLINIDADYMRQVIDNIVINSINFSDFGLIEVTLNRYRKYAELIIQDEGKGIPKEELYDVFNPFKMGSNTMSQAQGRGVGLALCKAAVEAHGGTIEAESDGIRGATFRIILPF